MTETTLISPPAVPAPSQILRRIALPFFLFSLVLFSLLIFSWMLILPAFTRVEVAGVSRDLGELSSFQASLVARVSQAEAERNESVLPIVSSVYESIKSERRGAPSFLNLRKDVLSAARATSPGTEAVYISSITYARGEKAQINIKGDVRNVGPRSMTVLADFTQELSRIPGIASVSTPRFVRIDDASGPRSPFDLTLTLK